MSKVGLILMTNMITFEQTRWPAMVAAHPDGTQLCTFESSIFQKLDGMAEN
jgi:hypothetical protein